MAFGGLKGTLTGNGASTTTSNALAGSVVVAVGDLVWVTFGEDTVLTASSVSDNLGNTYTAQNAGTDVGVVTARSFWSRVTVAGTLTSIAVACSSATTNNWTGVAAVIEGPFATSPLDTNPANATDRTSPFNCPATGTLAQADEVVMCSGVRDVGSAWAATSPNLLALDVTTQVNPSVAVGYQVVSATTTVTPVFTAAADPTNDTLSTASFKKQSTTTIAAGAGLATGSGGASAVGASRFDAAGASTGVAAATGVGSAVTPTAGAATGAAAATGVGTAITPAAGTSNGIGAAAGIGVSGFAAVGTAAGSGAATAVGRSTNAGAGASTGAGAAIGAGSARIDGAGLATGSSSAAGVGRMVTPGAGRADGAGNAAAVGTMVTPGAGRADGIGSAAGFSVTFQDDTEIICVHFEDRAMSARAENRAMIASAEDRAMEVLSEDRSMVVEVKREDVSNDMVVLFEPRAMVVGPRKRAC